MQRRSETLTNIISESMRRQMNLVNAVARFLLILKPGTAKLFFIPADSSKELPQSLVKAVLAAMDKAFADKYAELSQLGPKGIKSLSNARALFDLCTELINKARKQDHSLLFNESTIRAVAATWLEQNPLSLGDLPTIHEKESKTWRIKRSGASQLRFQDALDWCATYDVSIDQAIRAGDGERYKGCESVGLRGAPTILKVPLSVERENIVTLCNLKVFVAEHLLAYASLANFLTSFGSSPIAKDPGLTFYFQPLKGLGQYRAAIDWVAADLGGIPSHRTEQDLIFQTSLLQMSGLTSLFNQSLLYSFGRSLRQAIADMQAGDRQSEENVRRAFAELWWASEVRFFQHGQFVSRLIRAEDEASDDWETASEEPQSLALDWHSYEGKYSGFFATTEKGHPHQTFIKLNLSALIDAGAGNHPLVTLGSVDELQMRNTLKTWSFDEVIFACHFFQTSQTNNDLDEWVDRLGEVIIDDLVEQTVQPIKAGTRLVAGLESAAHWLNSLVRVADRAGSAQKIADIRKDLDAAHPRHGDLIEVQNRLQLLVLVEAGVGLMRLLGALGNEEHSKLNAWFTKESLAEWRRPDAFEKYQQSITHLAVALASAFGRPAVKVSVDGKETLYTEPCLLDLYELRFPPLSKQNRGTEPILAVLPALTEPITNALVYLQKQREGLRKGQTDSGPIEIVIEDRRRDRLPHILVKIGNRYFDGDEPISPSGIAKARELMKVAEVASIDDDLTIEKHVDGAYLWASVRLHPQMLYQRINQRP